MIGVLPLALALITLLLPTVACAHVALLSAYILPVPLPVYFFACAATLIITFIVIGYRVGRHQPTVPASRPFPVASGPRGHFIVQCVLLILRIGALACLALAVIAGYVGIKHPLGNISYLLFWTIFWLGLTYLTALIGNTFEAVNPWRTLVDGAQACGLDFSKARIAYPERLAYYPALLFYIAVVWIELFVAPLPSILATALIIYTIVTFAGSWLFGARSWFEYGEFFGVFFRLVGLLAPVAYARAENRRGWQLYLRRPILPLVETRPTHLSLVLFVVFMLSSTTYDALEQTEIWQNLFWVNALALTKPLWGTDLRKAQSMLIGWYLVYRPTGLILSPFVYFGFYWLAMWIMKLWMRTRIGVQTLVQEFAYSIIPIAFVYSVTHNLTDLLGRWRAMPALLTDPFGFGWNIFHFSTIPEFEEPFEMGPIWHTQVVLILVGHIVGVYVAHLIALRIFPERRQAILSQVPLLTLMVAYTIIGLTILTFPLVAAPD
jgi:hypothetical protein